MKKEEHYARRASTQSKCCGVVEEAANRTLQRRAARTGPQPWIARKLMVGVTFGIMAYTVYVFIGRLCVDMIRRREGAGGSRGTGIALLAVFSILWLWMVWAYAKVVFTPPGYAKDHVSQTDRPPYPEPPPFIPYDYDVENARYPVRPSHSQGPSRDFDQESIGGPSYENLPERQPTSPQKPFVDVHTSKTSVTLQERASNPPTKPELAYTKEKGPADYLNRRPPLAPILRPEHRYCETDRIVKPYRTHHCRNCGTCVLKYDHHCPWIGQCVGARNQKFFLNFVQAASVFTTYTFVTLLVFVIRIADSPVGDIDPQKVVIVALSGLFMIFTVVLGATHVRLIWLGQTTLENMQAGNMKRREREAMDDVIGVLAFCAKRRKARSYDEEWGRINYEGNIWWLGSGKKSWIDVMGQSVWGWFLPVGRSLNDGLTYPVNPRFDAQGIWRKRVEWPQELR